MDSRMLQTASQYQLASVAILALGCAALWPAGALGVLAGGLLMTGNFWFLKTMVQRVFDGPQDKAKAVYALLLAFKFAAVLGALALLILVLEVHPIGIAVGMTSLFFGIGFALVHHNLKPSQKPSQRPSQPAT